MFDLVYEQFFGFKTSRSVNCFLCKILKRKHATFSSTSDLV